ncbi:MAG: hypothetical protein HY360_18655 [Verrucomicrobia bacterium]|nr:hypothetical protein [Verrucomicrobiota bacterium]
MITSPQFPASIAGELRALDLAACLHRACNFLLRWQIGVETHVDDYWDIKRGWIKRPCAAWMCGAFPGDWFLGGAHDEQGRVWRMGIGPIWHTGQAIWALSMARPWFNDAAKERLDRAMAEGGHYLARLQILEGPNRGAFWTPPHSLPPGWNAGTEPTGVYMMPGEWVEPKQKLCTSDMSEAVGGLLTAGDLLKDPVMIETCRRWGEWLAREVNFKPGYYYHWFSADQPGGSEMKRFWQPDDGVQGLLAVKFNNADWLKRYHDGVKRCIEWPIDLKEYPAQQARSFYWNASFLWPVIDGRIPGDRGQGHPGKGDRDRAVKKLEEYTNWLLGLVEPDGMVGFKYQDKGGLEDRLGTSGDGAATAMGARMCYQLWKNTDDPRWCEAAAPLLRWIVQAQIPPSGGQNMEGDAPSSPPSLATLCRVGVAPPCGGQAPQRPPKFLPTSGLGGAIPFCRWMLDAKTGKRFQFMRSISTIFAIMALSEWLGLVEGSNYD